MKVPDVLFYENPQHLAIMEDMLKDYMLGEHLLLVGNQGVGKNKIVDRFLYLLNRPREYLQLHRYETKTNLHTLLDKLKISRFYAFLIIKYIERFIKILLCSVVRYLNL